MENLFLRMNIERGMTLGVEWAEAEELTTGSPKSRELADERGQVNTRFQFACIDAACVV